MEMPNLDCVVAQSNVNRNPIVSLFVMYGLGFFVYHDLIIAE